MTLLLAFLTMLAVVAAMAVGVIFGRKPISGSCGGMKALGMDVSCEICGGNPELCDTEPSSNTVRTLFHPARQRSRIERPRVEKPAPADRHE